MLSRRVVAARPLARLAPAHALRPRFFQNQAPETNAPNTKLKQAEVSEMTDYSNVNDPYMNGGFINPPIEKRNNRDPYGEWWDKQDKRNYGEPVHEDNDILGALSLHDYDHFTPGWAGVLLGCFGVAVVGLCGVTAFMYPDKKSVPKCYPDGLEAELGGPRAVRARKEGDAIDWKDYKPLDPIAAESQ